MISLSIIAVSCLFSVFVFLDLVSHAPRLSGSLLGLNGLGFAFQTMVNTVKRIFLVLIPPALGLVAINGKPTDVFVAVFTSHFSAIISFLVVFFSRQWIVDFFCSTIRSYAEGSGIMSAFADKFRNKRNNEKPIEIKIDARSVRGEIFLSAVWIFFFYTSAGFLINIFAVASPDYSFIILQLTGVINACGTLVLAFFLDPRISRIYEHGGDVETVYVSLFFAQFANVVVISPFFYLIIFLSVF